MDAVEQWATDFLLIREIGIVSGNRRLDGVLVPKSGEGVWRYMKNGPGFWDWFGLLGLEVKMTRGDFQRGVNDGQFERYRKAVAGLFLVTPPKMLKPAEVPDGLGHLIVYQRSGSGLVCTCRKKPEIRKVEPTSEQMWRLIFRIVQATDEKIRKTEAAKKKWEEQMGDLASRHVMATLRKMRKAVD
uniref:Uncharacterized protein n=1 Tax=viral metagenome TaxID=1070528 RepID=A0A6M3M2G6_9ZZZZ